VFLNGVFLTVASVRVTELLSGSPDVTHADFYLLVYVTGLITTDGGGQTQVTSNVSLSTKLFILSNASKVFEFEYYESHQTEKNEIR
jgi:hypothetical protein